MDEFVFRTDDAGAGSGRAATKTMRDGGTDAGYRPEPVVITSVSTGGSSDDASGDSRHDAWIPILSTGGGDGGGHDMDVAMTDDLLF